MSELKRQYKGRNGSIFAGEFGGTRAALLWEPSVETRITEMRHDTIDSVLEWMGVKRSDTFTRNKLDGQVEVYSSNGGLLMRFMSPRVSPRRLYKIWPVARFSVRYLVWVGVKNEHE